MHQLSIRCSALAALAHAAELFSVAAFQMANTNERPEVGSVETLVIYDSITQTC